MCGSVCPLESIAETQPRLQPDDALTSQDIVAVGGRFAPWRLKRNVPEPTTIAGGLLGVLGLCWFQRRRLIRSVRLRRA
jgi:hypothetical protein